MFTAVSGSFDSHSSANSAASAMQALGIEDSNKSLYDFYEKIENENSKEIEKLGGHLERSLAYDAVWVMAYSLNQTLNR